MKKKLALALLFPLALAACGGSDDDDSAPAAPEAPPAEAPPPVDPVTQGSQDTASRLGLAAIDGNSDTVQVYDVVADVGDTWRLTLDKQAGTYKIDILHTEFGLTSATGTYTSAGDDKFTTVTGADGAFVLLIDQRTRTLTGAMTLGGKNTSVTGSSYAMPADLSTLAGTYAFFASVQYLPGAERRVMMRAVPAVDFVGGTLLLKADGNIVLCPAGQATSDGGCASLPEGTPFDGLSARLVRSDVDGEVHVIAEEASPSLVPADPTPIDVGIVRIQAGDRGPVLTVDLMPENGLFGYRSTGVLYAGQQARLQGNEMDGGWHCALRGQSIGTLQATGSAMHALSDDGSVDDQETLHYNQANADVLFDLNGFVTATAHGEDTAEGTLYVPLSASLVMAEIDSERSIGLCRPTGN